MDFVNKFLSTTASIEPIPERWIASVEGLGTVETHAKSFLAPSTYDVYTVGTLSPRHGTIRKFNKDGFCVWAAYAYESYSLFTLIPKAVTLIGGSVYCAFLISNGTGCLLVKLNADTGAVEKKVKIYRSASRPFEIESFYTGTSGSLVIAATYREPSLSPQFRAAIVVLDLSDLTTITYQKQYIGTSNVYVKDIGASSTGYAVCGSHGNELFLMRANANLSLDWSISSSFDGGPDVAYGMVSYLDGATQKGYVVGKAYNTSTLKNEGVIYSFGIFNIGSIFKHITHTDGVSFSSVCFDSNITNSINVVGKIEAATPPSVGIKFDEASGYISGKTYTKDSNTFLHIAGSSRKAMTTSTSVFMERIDDAYTTPNWGGYAIAASSLTESVVSPTITSSVVTEDTLSINVIEDTEYTVYTLSRDNITHNLANRAV